MNKILFCDIWSCNRSSNAEIFCAVAVLSVPVWGFQWKDAPVSGGKWNLSTSADVGQIRTLEG